MKVRGICSSIVIAAVAVGPAAADARKQLPVQQAPVQVTCEVIEIWASHGKGGIDGAIPKRLATRVTSTFKWTEYKQLSNTAKAFEKKKAEAVKLKKGSATFTLIEIVDKSNVRLSVDFNAAKGNSKQTLTVAGGDWVMVAAKESNDPNADGHILAVGNCK